MKFKSYAGRSLDDIVPAIRAELGPEAVILKQRPTQSGGLGGFFAKRGVEVLAADRPPAASATAVADPPAEDPATPEAPPAEAGRVDVAVDGGRTTADLLAETFAQALRDQGAPAPQAAEAAAPLEEPDLPAADALLQRAAAAATGYAPPAFRGVTALKLESAPAPRGGLHIAPLPVFETEPEPELADDAADVLLELERAGVSTDVARNLIDEVRLHVAPFSDRSLRDLARDRIAARIRTEQGWARDGAARRVAVAGPSGVGKTSAVVALAAAWADAGLSVALISVVPSEGDDGHPLAIRLGAAAGSDAERVLALAGGAADLVRVSTPQEAARAIARFADRDVVVIDTPSLGHANGDEQAAIRETLAALAPHEVHAALPLALAGREADAALAALARLGASHILVTKTDEARFAGPLLDLAERSALPLSYLGTAPSVPGQLVPADGGSIARRILPI